MQNLHTHTTFCDGKNTAEEMILSAIDKGFSSLGFSGHSPIKIANDWCMSEENLLKYHKNIDDLKEKFKEKIEIFKGIETEQLFLIDKKDFDYSISSVHLIEKDGNFLEVDHTKDIFTQDVSNFYGGDFYKYIEDYYKLVCDCNGDILGHFDLITKFNENNVLFDETSKKYLDIAIPALEHCIKKDMIIEVNTGAIQRGYRKSFYPNLNLLSYLKNAKIIVTTDCHSIDGIDFYYAQAVEILKNHGFKNQVRLTKNGFSEVRL